MANHAHTASLRAGEFSHIGTSAADDVDYRLQDLKIATAGRLFMLAVITVTYE
ncbi:MAG TPA: hypothetical protein VMT53_05740 [Terriglobales bacterium]|nr:hypothetical protein [Terriglobales bacterium]